MTPPTFGAAVSILAAAFDPVVVVRLEPPVSYPRIRFNGATRQAFHKGRYTSWKATATADVINACRGRRPRIAEPVAVEIEFRGARPNADVDNLAKSVLDVLTGTVIQDDRFVGILLARRTPEKPAATVVSVFRIPPEIAPDALSGARTGETETA